ncbi:hypothetical protein R84981_002620 [Carnimonas sp. R-84981]|uniref:SixA phosphatase family protein n=1 Tax=Carnimonas bestiolae TaxID=3402172 RepID=UPI003EDBAF5B
MRLWIMRHGEAASGVIDAERPLTAAGEVQVRGSARWLCDQRQPGEPLTIIHSPFRRARQSAIQVLKTLTQCAGGDAPQQLWENEQLTPEHSVDALIDWLTLQQWHGDWLLVSHMPLVASLSGALVEGRGHLGSPFTTAQVVGLDADVWASGCASQVALFTPTRHR